MQTFDMQEHEMQRLVTAIVESLLRHPELSGQPAVRAESVAASTVPPATVPQSIVSSSAVLQPVAAAVAQTPSIDATGALPDITTPENKRRSTIAAPHKPEVLAELQKATGARMGTGKTGPRPPVDAYLRFLADHARSKGTVFKEVPEEWLAKNNLWSIRTLIEDKDTYLTRPDLGRLLSSDSLTRLRERYPSPSQVQIVLSDGLSTDALLHNYEEILPSLVKGLKNAGLSVGEPFFLRYGRVKAEDVIGEALGCDVILLLIGERPGLGQSESMSCYAVYRPTSQTIESQRTVISNIHKGGLPPVEASAVIMELAANMIRHKASGIELNHKMGGQYAPGEPDA